jgi:hypothetical protein
MLIAVSAAPVWADWGGPVDCTKDPKAPQCTIQVSTPGSPGSPGSSGTVTCKGPAGETEPCYVQGVGWLGSDGCYWRPMTPAELAPFPDVFPPPAPPGQWYIGSCGKPPDFFPITKYQVFNGPPNAAVLADAAVKALRLPTPVVRLNPAPPAPQLVGLPTWVWLDGGSWGSRSATASVPGLSVTATALPAQLTLTTSDGATVSCKGPGTAWAAGTDPRAASPSCGHTFTSAGAATVTATVTWNVSWAGGGQTGTVPAITTTATVAAQVQESAGLNTGVAG